MPVKHDKNGYAVYAAILLLAYSFFKLDKNLTKFAETLEGHMDKCDESSKRVSSILRIVLGALITQVVVIITAKFIHV